MLREKINAALKTAMLEKEQIKVSTLRLVNAALKDRDIALRAESRTLAEDEILSILKKMVKQRRESSKLYEQGGRMDLLEQEQREIEVIEEFLPAQLSEEDVRSLVDAVVAQVGAQSIKDMGKVMGSLRAKHSDSVDFEMASRLIKEKLQG